MMDGLILLACDSTPSLYFHNLRQKFEEIGVQRVSPTMKTEGKAGMGVLQLSYWKRLLDIFKTNFADDTHTLYKTSAEIRFSGCDDSFRSPLNTSTWVGTAFLH